MRTIGALADRMLGAVVPKIKAGACCPADPTLVFCYCVGPNLGVGKVCSYNCACQISCGGCNTYKSDSFC